MPYRTDKLSHAFRQEISAILLRELRDKVPGLPTITEVKVGNDLSLARVYVSVFGAPELQRETLAKLSEQAGFIRKLLGRRLRIRKIPELRFVFDETIEHGDRMRQIFAEIGKEGSDEPQTSDLKPQTSDQAADDAPGTDV
jgi:ribosome-binding factor A